MSKRNFYFETEGVPRTHLKPYECLRCKAKANLCEKQGGCGENVGLALDVIGIGFEQVSEHS
jgi:hypothetical protein